MHLLKSQNMKKIIPVLICLFTFFSGVAFAGAVSYKMIGTFDKDVKVGKYAVLYIYETKVLFIKEIKNRIFSFEGQVSSEKMTSGYGNGLILFTDNQNYNINSVKKDLVDTNTISCILEPEFNLVVKSRIQRSSITGPLNTILMSFKKMDWKYSDIRRRAYAKIDSIKLQLRTVKSEKVRIAKQHEITDITNEQVLVLSMEKLRSQLKLVNDHINSPVALSTLYLLALMPHTSIAEIKVVYDKLPPDLAGSIKGQALKKQIDKRASIEKANVKLMDQAPLFELTDVSQKAVKLNQFKGKYVLLEFWASWCGPCRSEMPALKNVKRNNNNLVLIAISLDKEKDKWLKAIKEDNISEFINLIDKSAFDSEIVKSYGINYIPQNYLLDHDGKVIAKNIYGKQLEARIASLMMN